MKVRGDVKYKEVYALWVELYKYLHLIKDTKLYKDWKISNINIEYTTDKWLRDLPKYKINEYYRELIDLKNKIENG